MYVGMRTTSRGMRSVIHELSIGLKRLTSLRPAFGDGFVHISGSYGGGGAVGGLLQSELLTTNSGGDRIISVSRFHAVASMPTTTTTTIIGAESRSSSLLLPAMAIPLADPSRLVQARFNSSSNEVLTADLGSRGGIVEIELAQTGEGIADCELIRWFVKEGDMVEEFDPVCEVQSDKASVSITSRYKGKVSNICFMPGDVVKVGETLLELIVNGSSNEQTPVPAAQQEEQWQEEASTLRRGVDPENASEEGVKKEILATPAVRHMAKNYGISLVDVVGTGKDGRIMKEDFMKHVAAKEAVREDLEPEGHIEELSTSVDGDEYSPIPPATDSGYFSGEDTIIPIRGFRRAMANAMTAAVKVPHFHYMEEMDVDALVELKNTLSTSIPLPPGVKLTYLPFLIKSLSAALLKHPIMNSTVNEDVTEIRVKASHNIGVAMATSFGLVVPNVKNVQRMSVLEIATELSRLIQLAGKNMLATEDISGGTITVSNFGAIGGKFGSPIINVPEVAIVAIGRMQQVPRLQGDGSFVNSSVMTVTWGADHRVIDGATVAHFCNEWKLLIEQPERLFLHLR
ncbi:unnamed protein product [Sphagnum troendelagicum]|uniref:Dihydrolipoamide acetyltransferase component of pyruvate dehydrogenase complex n=1 Tax=Sphagnum troendelagicum TaxID=128251 RepID=A0ABP0UE44_9BRYO